MSAKNFSQMKSEANRKVCEHLRAIAVFRHLRNDNQFSVRSYDTAIAGIEDFDYIGGVITEHNLSEISGVGKGIGETIKEFLRTGTSNYYIELSALFPIQLLEHMVVPGIGPKRALALYEAGYHSFQELVDAANTGKLDKKLAEAVIVAAGSMAQRYPYATVKPIADSVLKKLLSFNGVERGTVAGSIRRLSPDSKDIDICLCLRDNNDNDYKAWLLNEIYKLGTNFEGGAAKASIVVKDEGISIKVDVWFCDASEWGARLMYSTGSKAFNIRMRERAIKLGFNKLNEKGLYLSGGTKIDIESEEKLFTLLKMDFVQPKDRK